MKKTAIITNIAIAAILLVLSISIFSIDLERVYSGSNTPTVAAPVTIGNRNLKNVSFMICIETDTDPAIVTEMMNAFSLRSVSATFFVSGSWAMRNPQTLRHMHTLGFEIANHGFSGRSIKGLSAEKQKKEIQDTHTLVKGLTNIEMKLFFPPAGEYSKDTLKVAQALGYTVVLSCCNVDTNSPSATADAIFNAATSNPKNGDLILLCPTRNAVTAIPNIIDFYLGQEFGIIKVSDNIAT